MSNHLISTAYKRNLGSLLRKSVMALLADKASDDGGGIYASKQTIADELCCTKQSVITTIKQFVAEGLLIETGLRRCANGATVEYAINVEALEALPLVGCHEKRSTSLTGQRHSPVNVTEARGQSALPKPNEPKSPTKATPSTEKRAAKTDPFPCPQGVDPVDWSGLIANRKAKRAALSEGAHRQIVRKLDQWAAAGWPPGPIVAHAAERGWTSVFETDEMKGSPHARQPHSRPAERPSAALALIAQARAESAGEDEGDHWGAGAEVPRLGWN